MRLTDADITARAKRYIAEYLNDHPKELALLSALRKSPAPLETHAGRTESQVQRHEQIEFA
jgi:hypothetical protein